ncbi:MAG: hypothetical protein ACK4K7_13960 [Allosphingosinicella sp.]|uniref:hemerythrin domain-containing protein n=1 Tax=Allosphingosinicella sp. TaxID=2823234 RepID=UPI0039628CCE
MSRHDIYGPIHKGLRLALSDLLVRLGRADFADRAGSEGLLADLRRQMQLSADHLKHEEHEIHAALEARVPGAAARLEQDHDHHRDTFVEMEEAIRRVEAAEGEAERRALGRHLYLRFSRFAAEDFAHMAEEETVTLPLLHAHFTDEELIDIEARIIASCTPEDNLAYLRIMIGGMNRPERVHFLGFMRHSAPPEVFEATMNFAARPTLDPADYRHLEESLGLAA